jgi:trans-aconitate 2-methyltransferase
MWDTTQYLRFGGERARPFFDLIASVGADKPGFVVDMGCGPGNLTATLAERWPSATVVGVDSSAEMIEAAQARVKPADAPGLSFMRDDIRHWKPQALPDVIVSNAVLQWVPEHREVLADWASWLPDEGWLAVQVPGNFDQPSHVLLRELAEAARWRPFLKDVNLTRKSADPADYAGLLAQAGCEVDAWETTYLHILQGPDPVLEWIKGTGLRPVLAVLDAEQAADFLADYGEQLREAYPRQPFGTVFPFRRIFAVAYRAS